MWVNRLAAIVAVETLVVAGRALVKSLAAASGTYRRFSSTMRSGRTKAGSLFARRTHTVPMSAFQLFAGFPQQRNERHGVLRDFSGAKQYQRPFRPAGGCAGRDDSVLSWTHRP